MMYQEIKGDLFSIDCDYLVHGCNAQGVMGSGVAKTVKELYPNAFRVYKEFCDSTREKDRLGKIVISDEKHHITGKPFKLVNAITQLNFGKDGKRYVSYDAVGSCFTYLSGIVEPKSVVVLPKIGAGLGGGNWKTISQIIQDKINCDVRVYFI
jgi:O-acetyl-ADP-ribose deacetylase (regulator of RNase III)